MVMILRYARTCSVCKKPKPIRKGAVVKRTKEFGHLSRFICEQCLPQARPSQERE